MTQSADSAASSAARLPGRGIVAVHAHPDDETLTHGGTLAAWAQAGQPVAIVTCTRGEQGEVIPADLHHLEGNGPALAEIREAELAAAAAALGVTHQIFLDQLPLTTNGAAQTNSAAQTNPPTRYEDSGMVWVGHGAAGAVAAAPSSLIAADKDVAAQRLAGLIRQLRPRFLLTYEPGGGYGHPDHVRAREIAVRAAQIAADPDQILGLDPWEVPAILGSVVPAGVLRAGRDELAARHAAGQISGVESLRPETGQDALPALARQDETGILELDVSPHEILQARAAALAAHRTQIQGVRSFKPQTQPPYLAGAYGLSNNFYSPLFTRDFFLPDPDWSGVEVTADDLIPPAPSSET